jgi:hypothetical protein
MFAARRTDTAILQCASLLLIAGLAAGMVSPPLFWVALCGAGAAGIALLAFRHPTGFCVAWLLVAGMSLEMTLHDLFDDAAYQATIAAVKTTGIALAAACALRFGPRVPLAHPVWAYAAMLCAGFAHGLYPGLTAADSARSMIGSVAPFAFCFCRLPRAWPGAMIRAAKWCPAAAVAACRYGPRASGQCSSTAAGCGWRAWGIPPSWRGCACPPSTPAWSCCTGTVAAATFACWRATS